MKTEIKIRDKIYKIEIVEPKDNLLNVRVNEKNYFFAQDEFGRLNKVDERGLSLSPFEENEIIREPLRDKEIKCPLAGTVSCVFVKRGDIIKPGQKMLTLISMKMENEIVSENNGKIKEVRAKENQFVNAGKVLIILE